MYGDSWQKFGNVRCLFAYMFTHPVKTLFMGMEIGQVRNVWETELHTRHIETVCARFNHIYRSEPALHDFQQAGFEWIDCRNRHSVAAFIRRAQEPEDLLRCAILHLSRIRTRRAGAGIFTV